ncbi:MAG: AmmeMemoRadiSam system radical SAM enzyme [Planctomycetaceae bacterium]|jgi:pyruvate formate lyase activating enzyme|nr:AmmeMemoRadiSam system radical SAM enzyme [Planctomycetaceae bacterium]
MEPVFPPARWWHRADNSDNGDVVHDVICELCPRRCRIAHQKSGFCRVRQNHHGQLINAAYGRSTGFCLDPVEKKPLYHFLPGTPTLSFGTVGCNLECRFCQNYQTSCSHTLAPLRETASPAVIAETALSLGCPSVSFTYNEPVIWSEFVVDTALECRKRGIKTIAVTNGFISQEPAAWFFPHLDAVNVDLKGFTDDFYKRLTGGSLAPVLETLRYIVHETALWLEITNLLIPGENDRSEEIHAMCEWIARELGVDIPLHFSSFHPMFRLMRHPPTPPETLIKARQIAREHGLRYVYLGNIRGSQTHTTVCPSCGSTLLERTDYGVVPINIDLPVPDTNTVTAQCRQCRQVLPGVYPPRMGIWGNKRQPVSL